MRTGHLIFSAVHFFFLAILACAGTFFLSIPKLPHLRLLAVKFFSLPNSYFFLAGGLIFSIALSLLIGFFAMYRGRYFQIKMRSHAALVELPAIRAIVERYWKEKFPEIKTSADVILHSHQKIEILAPLADAPNLEELLKEVERELGALLAHSLGYHQDFRLTLLSCEK